MAKVTDQRCRSLLEALDKIVGVRVVACEVEVPFDSEGRRAYIDHLVRARLGEDERETALAIESMDTVYPRDAQKLVERFAARAWSLDGVDEVPLVVASHLSDGAQKVLRDGRVNFFHAASGTMYFRHRQRHIDIQRPTSEPLERKIRSVFNGAREQVVHALLVHRRWEGGKAWVSGTDLAEMAGTSPFTVSTTLQELERQAWIEVTGSGPTLRRRLSRPELLLDAWADAWKRRLPKEPRSRWYAYAGGGGGIIDYMLERLAGFEGWALTGAGAANAVVPHLTPFDRATIIVPPGLSKEWGAKFGLEPADKGANVTFIERTGAALMFGDSHPERPGSRFASPFVMYLDLLDGVGRNKELAAEFRSRALQLGEATNG
ncbi:MAG: hypothetical protein CL725_10195 [Chloroflexi bacterium]|nr:hypothetical protein [Chloroflexota bacterium]|tara:strand:- start:8131 stop:9258 length:1128 start_codon:yes stop_codon:yes gene_type:complete